MTWLLTWLNVSVATLNATSQFLVIYWFEGKEPKKIITGVDDNKKLNKKKELGFFNEIQIMKSLDKQNERK